MKGEVKVSRWTIQSMVFSRPEYWSGWRCPSPEDLPNTGIEPRSPTLRADSLPAEPQGTPEVYSSHIHNCQASYIAQWGKNPPAMKETQEMQVRSLGQEDPLEEGHGHPPQYSCLENSTDRGAWWAIAHRLAKSWTQRAKS